MGEKGFREVYAQMILCLSVLIQAYKAILMALYPSDPVNPNFCPNPDQTILLGSSKIMHTI